MGKYVSKGNHKPVSKEMPGESWVNMYPKRIIGKHVSKENYR